MCTRIPKSLALGLLSLLVCCCASHADATGPDRRHRRRRRVQDQANEAAGGPCEADADCDNSACALPEPTLRGLSTGKVCCPTGSYVEFSGVEFSGGGGAGGDGSGGGPLDVVCADQPSGTFCGNNDDVCASGSCVAASSDLNLGWCDGFPSYEDATPAPPTRFLTAAEFVRVLHTEAHREFGQLEELTYGMDITFEELGRRAEEVWDDASRFELARAVRAESSERYPYVICSDSEGESGHQRKRKVRAAIREAMDVSNAQEMDDISMVPLFRNAVDGNKTQEADELTLVPLYNEADMTCDLAMLHGTVARSIACDHCMVQPVIQAMKMMPETPAKAEALMKLAIAEYYEVGGVRGTKDVSGKEMRDFPSLDIVTCAGAMSKEEFESFQALDEGSDGTIKTSDFNYRIFKSIMGLGDDIAHHEMTQNIYWFNPNAKKVFPESYEGDLGIDWWGVVDYTISGTKCERFFRERLTWTATLGKSEKDYFYQRVYWNNTQVREEDEYCLLGLLALIAVDRTVCQMEITAEKSVNNQNAAFITQTGLYNQTPWYDLGLDGTGQTVAVSDTGLDTNNCYFWDAVNGPPTQIMDARHRKIVQFIAYADHDEIEWGHGTHVCGTVAGKRATNGIDESSGVADGVAPGAKIAFIDIARYEDNDGKEMFITPPVDTLFSTGAPAAKIHSASWGSPKVNYYDITAKSWDDYLYDNPDLLAVVAAGNEGRYDKANTVASPSVAKNVLAVGAHNSFGFDLDAGELGPAYIADFSSLGPTADGRMKPQVMTAGKYVLSAGARPSMAGECDGADIPAANSRSDGLLSKRGTSQATPVTSGTAALVRQYFEEGWYETGEKSSGAALSPSAAMLKAVLMNGAQADLKGRDNGSRGITPVAPYDNSQGFGRIDLAKSVYIAGKTDVQIKFWDYELIHDGDDEQYLITIDKSNGCTFGKVSATLVWTDPSAPAGCQQCVLHDLDLHVTKNGEDSIKYYPNGLSHADSINNAERVLLDASDGDNFTLHVTASNLNQATQDYALVATGCFGGVPNELDTSADVVAMDNSGDKMGGTDTTMIIIITCSVVGGVLVLLVVAWLIKKRHAKR